MIKLSRLTIGIAAILVLLITTFTRAQKTNGLNKDELFQRIKPAPESVFTMFREAEMQPANHELTSAQKEKVHNAFSLLPPLHQRIWKEHLQSISFMDNMPNTALTSQLDSVGGRKMFNITFRASILDETLSQWATWKENTCFKPEEGYQLRVEAGNMNALIYVLLHEATHVVDVVTELTPRFERMDSVVPPTTFTKGIWNKPNVPAEPYLDSLLKKTRFRSGKPMDISLAPEVYQQLAKTPFPSLYGMAAWSEDLAELVSIYHMTQKLNQPFYIVVTKDNVEVARFEPMKNALVRRRLDQLATFYK